ncbi:MAG: flavin reductase family protein [Gemmatimonadetes bacterium]|mgnify:CR=1 FL=1|nr:flavin reductase family protein [Gemmatimonadota bacterium]
MARPTWAGAANSSMGAMDQKNSELFRHVMSRFPTGVTVVATLLPDGTPRGLTVNAFTSVSLDPPLVLVCIDKSAVSHGQLREVGRFAVTVLSVDQAAIARQFASRPHDGRFDSVTWRTSEGGSPILDEGAAWVDCVLDRVIEAGDHSIFLARVIGAESSGQEPLLFHAGAFGGTGA